MNVSEGMRTALYEALSGVPGQDAIAEVAIELIREAATKADAVTAIDSLDARIGVAFHLITDALDVP